jgi:hypothetical protein
MYDTNEYHSDLLEFLATPGITKKDREEVKIYNETAYTSPTLKAKLKHDLSKYAPAYSKPIFEKLIDSGDLVPVFMTKNLWQYLSKRKELDSTLGSYFWRADKIYVYMESILKYTKLKIFASTKPGSELIQTLFHELMHMSKYRNPKKFYDINRIPLLKFNSYVLFKYFEIKGDDNKKGVMSSIDNFNKFMIEYPKNRYMDKKKIKSFLDVVSDYSSLPQEKIDRLVDDYYNTMYYYDNSQQIYKWSSEIFDYMQEAYKKLFKFSVDLKWINEEFLVYDGIIAKLAQHNPNLPYVKKSFRIIV